MYYVHILCTIRKYNVIEPGFCAHGKKYCTVLSSEEKGLFEEAGITLPSCIVQYNSIHLINTSRIVKSKLKSKALLRDNSGVVFLNTSGNR